MTLRLLTSLALITLLLSSACADSGDWNLTAPPAPLFSMPSCELDVSRTQAYALIADLRVRIDALEASGGLTSGQANALRNHLDNAVRQLESGMTCPALGQLESFRHQVVAFQTAGVLTEAEAAPLLAAVDQVVEGGPLAVNDAYDANEDETLTVLQPGVLANDVDLAGGGLTTLLVAGPAHGVLSIFASGAFTYTPAVDFFGTDQFTYRASDGTATSNVATVTITVRSVNDGPVARDDSYTVSGSDPVIVSAPGVLANDVDVEADPLTAVLVGGPSNGALTLNADGSFSYTPGPDFSGSDQFTYRASDGAAVSNTATVSLTMSSAAAVAIGKR